MRKHISLFHFELNYFIFGLLLIALVGCQNTTSHSPSFSNVEKLSNSESTQLIISFQQDWDKDMVISHLESQVNIAGEFAYVRKLSTGGHLIRVSAVGSDDQETVLQFIRGLASVKALELDTVMKPFTATPLITSPIGQ